MKISDSAKVSARQCASISVIEGLVVIRRHTPSNYTGVYLEPVKFSTDRDTDGGLRMRCGGDTANSFPAFFVVIMNGICRAEASPVEVAIGYFSRA
jgi:hypothetical protein